MLPINQFRKSILNMFKPVINEKHVLYNLFLFSTLLITLLIAVFSISSHHSLNFLSPFFKPRNRSGKPRKNKTIILVVEFLQRKVVDELLKTKVKWNHSFKLFWSKYQNLMSYLIRIAIYSVMYMWYKQECLSTPPDSDACKVACFIFS